MLKQTLEYKVVVAGCWGCWVHSSAAQPQLASDHLHLQDATLTGRGPRAAHVGSQQS